MVEYAPATGGLALWVRHAHSHDPAAPPAATDGHTITYGPGFATLPLPEQAGWVAHQVLHVALCHPQRLAALRQRLGDVDERLFNLCADAIIHSALGHLAWLALPAGALTLPRLLHAALGEQADDVAALQAWDVERLYTALDDRPPRQPGRAGRDQRPDGPRSQRAKAAAPQQARDLRPAPGGDTQDPGAGAPEEQAAQALAWRERLQRAHAGDGEHSLLRTLLADLPRTRTPWEQVLRTVATQHLSRRLALSWSRPSRAYLAAQGRLGPGRRMPFEPGRVPARAAPRLALVVDVSGSIDERLLERFARELHSLARRLESRLTLVVGDDRVREVHHFEPGRGTLALQPFVGGGGTDFAPLLAEAARHRPDLVVVLTDLQGPAGPRPRVPVLWAVPEAQALAPPPFGRVLVLD